MVACPTCGRENPQDARFCNGCGAALAVEPRREERKVVTVLFADLVGFTSRAERLDPEDVRALLAPYWEHLRDELVRHGGTVEKFIGDAVMALFGAPVAHEDDPERAVRAALAIRDWARETPDLHVRTAVNTGEALVLLGASPAEGEGMAAGDVVNTAARLQAAAPTNGVLVGESTYRATRHVIEYAEHEPVAAKGKAEPVRVWEAVAARSAATVETVSAAPLVGRSDEVELLVAALKRVRREREPQLVTIAGVPGIGKSRLVAELFAFAEAEPDFVSWRRGRSLPYGDGVSLWALGEIAKAELGVLESDTREATAAKLAESLAGLVEDEQERGWLEQHVAPLVGLPAAQSERAERFDAWRRWIELLADRYPLVLVFEDLQWADAELLDFVDELADWAADVPLLVVCTTRPELFERRPGWSGGKRNAVTVSLGPLSDADTARIVASTLGRALLPADTQAALVERAAGNPLYAEQYARMLAEGASPGDLPETVQGIVAARLDLLPAAEKALLQDASVVGRSFWPGALAATEEMLRALVRKEFIRRERRSSIAGEAEYAFAHALVRDVAYAQIPRAQRAAGHRAAAAWIEALPADRAVDRAEMLAHHYAAALELARAAGSADEDLLTRTRLAFHAAGERALALNAFPVACRHLAAALELAAGAADEPDILLGLGTAQVWHEPELSVETLARAAAELLALGDRERSSLAESRCAQACWYLSRGDEAETHSERAIALLADAPPSEAKAEAAAQHARRLMLAGVIGAAVDASSAAIALAEEIGSERLEASARITRGTALGPAGGEDLTRGVALAEAAGDLYQQLRGLNNLAEHAAHTGDLPATRSYHTRYRALAERLGARSFLSWIPAQEAHVLLLAGDWDAALAHVEEALAGTETDTTYVEGNVRAIRAVIQQARGESGRALVEARRAIEAAQRAKDPQIVVPALAAGALVFAQERRLEEGRASLEEALAILGGLERIYYSAPLMLAFPVLDLGMTRPFADVLVAQGASDAWSEAALYAWRGDLSAAAAAYARFGASWLEAEARLRTGDSAEVHRALDFFRDVGAAARIRDAEAMLAATA